MSDRGRNCCRYFMASAIEEGSDNEVDEPQNLQLKRNFLMSQEMAPMQWLFCKLRIVGKLWIPKNYTGDLNERTALEACSDKTWNFIQMCNITLKNKYYNWVFYWWIIACVSFSFYIKALQWYFFYLFGIFFSIIYMIKFSNL